FSSRSRHTRFSRDWSSDVCSSDLKKPPYSFQYNQIQLPAKNSLAIDYWGYYNGANNEDIKDYKFYDLDVPGYVINQEITNTGSKIGRASCREREDISEENISI